MIRLFLIVCTTLFFSTTLLGDALDSIAEKHVLRVCVWPEYYSISYVNPRTQKLTGIDVDLAHAFAKSLEVEPLFISSSFATLIDDLNSRKCDIAMFGIGITKERQQALRFTSAHLATDIYAIASKSNTRIQNWSDIDQEGVIVAVAKGTYHVGVMQKTLTKATLRVVDSLHAREKEVESGRADVFMSDYPFGIRLLHEREWAKMITPPLAFHKTSYGWALALDEERLYEKAEAFMQTIKHDGTLLEAAKRHQLLPIVVRD